MSDCSEFLHRFVTAQEDIYEDVIRELKGGVKRSHWVWFIFPQIAGLGHSSTAKYFELHSLEGYWQINFCSIEKVNHYA